MPRPRDACSAQRLKRAKAKELVLVGGTLMLSFGEPLRSRRGGGGGLSVLQVRGPHPGQQGRGERPANTCRCRMDAPLPRHPGSVTDGRSGRWCWAEGGRPQTSWKWAAGSSRARRIYQAEKRARDRVGGRNTDVDAGRASMESWGGGGRAGCRERTPRHSPGPGGPAGHAETGRSAAEPSRGPEPQQRLASCDTRGAALRNVHTLKQTAREHSQGVGDKNQTVGGRQVSTLPRRRGQTAGVECRPH